MRRKLRSLSLLKRRGADIQFNPEIFRSFEHLQLFELVEFLLQFYESLMRVLGLSTFPMGVGSVSMERMFTSASKRET